MDYTILDFLSLLGAVCLFLYGMKVMSEGLQKVAGDRLRNILGIMTKTAPQASSPASSSPP